MGFGCLLLIGLDPLIDFAPVGAVVADGGLDEAERDLEVACCLGGELLALTELSFSAYYAGDHGGAVRLARQAGQITAGIPGGLVRLCSYVLTIVLAGAGDLAEAERAGAAGLARARDAGDLWNQALLLPRIVDLDLRAGRTGDAAAHLREGLHLAVRTGNWHELLLGLLQCGELCAATSRVAEAPTLWAAVDRHQGSSYPPWFETRREEQLRQARQALDRIRDKTGCRRRADLTRLALTMGLV